MPITFSFDIDNSSVRDSNDRTRIRVAFSRLGWEHVGGSSWRYPALNAEHPSEDWFNHVIPALMYFRSLIERNNIVVTRYSLDAHSSAAYRSGNPEIGAAIKSSYDIEMYEPLLEKSHKGKLSKKRLREFIKKVATASG